MQPTSFGLPNQYVDSDVTDASSVLKLVLLGAGAGPARSAVW